MPEASAGRWQHLFHLSFPHPASSHSISRKPGDADGNIQNQSGEEGRIIIIFTGKYGNINFKIKITYYPTLPCEYNNSMIPHIATRWRDPYGILKQRRMPQLGHKATNPPEEQSGAARQRMTAKSIRQSSPSESKGSVYPSLKGEDVTHQQSPSVFW